MNLDHYADPCTSGWQNWWTLAISRTHQNLYGNYFLLPLNIRKVVSAIMFNLECITCEWSSWLQVLGNSIRKCGLGGILKVLTFAEFWRSRLQRPSILSSTGDSIFIFALGCECINQAVIRNHNFWPSLKVQSVHLIYKSFMVSLKVNGFSGASTMFAFGSVT